MASWIDILNGQIDTDSPVTQSLMTALRDNPIAAFEGASGAPRLVLKAIDPVAVGDTARSSVSGSYTAGTTSGFTDLHTFAFAQIGTARFKTTGNPTRLYRTRAGTQSLVAETISGSSFSADIGVRPGDEFLFQMRNAVGTVNYTATICTDGGDLWPGSAQNVTGNDHT